jgi:hypothetical protein
MSQRRCDRPRQLGDCAAERPSPGSWRLAADCGLHGAEAPEHQKLRPRLGVSRGKNAPLPACDRELVHSTKPRRGHERPNLARTFANSERAALDSELPFANGNRFILFDHRRCSSSSCASHLGETLVRGCPSWAERHYARPRLCEISPTENTDSAARGKVLRTPRPAPCPQTGIWARPRGWGQDPSGPCSKPRKPDLGASVRY